jgi:hypothetical protein
MMAEMKLKRGNPTGANQYAPGNEEKVSEKPIPLEEVGIDKNLAHRARMGCPAPRGRARAGA